MGDRLTLETADDERVWVVVIAETCSTREADAAVRAYRERLPEPRDPRACSDCGATDCEVAHISTEEIDSLFGVGHAEKSARHRAERGPTEAEPWDGPCVWGHAPSGSLEPDACEMGGDWRLESGRVFCDEHAAMAAIMELDGDAWARVRSSGDSGGHNRGPTEGASDAAVDLTALEELAEEMWAPGSHMWSHRIRVAIGCEVPVEVRERPPTGEASPDISDLRRAYREAVDEGATAERERDEARAKLGTLIGAVKSLAADILLEDLNIDGIIERLDDAAKGDAPTASQSARARCTGCYGCGECVDDETPTATSSPTTSDPRPRASAELEAKVTAAIKQERGPRAPAPQVPDSPGWWMYGDEPKHVVSSGGGLQVWVRDQHQAWLRPILNFDASKWGGRCTRDAPDDGLRARVEALREALLSYEADPGKGGPRLALAVGDALGDA